MKKTNLSRKAESRLARSQTEETNTSARYLNLHDQFRLKLSATLSCAIAHPEVVHDLQKIEAINESADGFNIYDTSYCGNIHPESALTFHPSPESFTLPEEVRNMLESYGPLISGYYFACKNLIKGLPKNHRWKRYLEHSKPQWMLEIEDHEEREHAFLRPDFILTDSEPIVTEIESSPFGLALSHFLAKTYIEQGEDVLGSENVVIETLRNSLVSADDSKDGVYALMFTDHTQKYQGQLKYLAEQLVGLNVVVIRPEDVRNEDGHLTYNGKKVNAIYRGFYLHESIEDEKLEGILRNTETTISPPCLPKLEEKALMGLIFDPEFEDYFRDKMGDGVDALRTIFPRTWVVDGEVPNDLPMDSWEELANISRKERSYVLKTSGFSSDSSWAKGVTFLGRLSKVKCRKLIRKVLGSDATYVLQEFRKGSKFAHPYFDFHAETMKTMHGRVRLTPYYSVANGSLLTAKVTMCENTDYVHAMVDSINVPVK